MSRERCYVDIHVLQTVPPSCVNRDDTGSPKTAVYGGATRARVSSQAWKHAMRKYFEDIFSGEDLGKRTKKVVGLVEEEIKRLNPEAAAETLAKKALENAGIKIKDAEKSADALFFMSQAQARALAVLAVEGEADKKAYKEALYTAPSFDLALFGRMVASDPSLNYDASAQVAHSISTHAIHNEYDYFTAVDDCAPEDNAGAGHLGTIEFNSSTLYRYATLNVEELEKNVGKDTPRVVRGFLEAFIKSMPDGKQNTFANRTVPDAVYVAIRKDQPVNLCGAFEKPVYSADGYVEASVRKLCAYAEKVCRDYVDSPEVSLAVGEGMETIGKVMPLTELLDTVKDYMDKRLSAAGGEA